MASTILGKEKFREGLRNYMAKHQYKNTVTLDLWTAWSEVSGIDVAAIMDSWTKQMGYPYLKVVSEKWSDSSVELTLEQNWFLADGSSPSAEEAGKLWAIPLLFSTQSSVSDTAVIIHRTNGKCQILLAYQVSKFFNNFGIIFVHILHDN